MNNSTVTLLTPEYLSNTQILKEISCWLHITQRPQGWHYDMDEVWQLENRERANIPKGGTILDAGAGLGAMQYVLAARGYNVVSLDFCKREKPKEAKGIFDLRIENQEGLQYQHAYQKFIVHSASSVRPKERPSFFKKLKTPHLSLRLFYKMRRKLFARLYRAKEMLRKNGSYGTITFVRAAFHEIPFEDNSFDAVISVSALEHADINLLDKNVNEMMRVAKPKAPVLISTSAIDQEADRFDEKTQGWCFSANTMTRFAKNAREEYEKYKDVERKILQSEIWRSRIDPYYFTDPDSSFYRKHAIHLPYLPIGLFCTK